MTLEQMDRAIEMSAPEKCPKCGAELLSRSFGEVTFYCGSRNSHPSKDSVWLQESAVCIRNQRDQLAKRVCELEAWKESAMAVDRQWDPQALAVMLGAKPGEDTRVVIQREVPKLVNRQCVCDKAAMYLEWGANRFVNVYDENPNVDFVLGMKATAAKLKGQP